VSPSTKPTYRELSIDLVKDPAAPARGTAGFGDMDSLAASIRAVGIIEPLVVAQRDGHVEVVAGHRRLLAARQIGLVTIPCLVFHSFRVAEDAVKLHENLERADLNPVDEARQYASCLDRCGGDTDAVAARFHQRRDRVEARLALLNGDPDVLAALEVDAIPTGVAAELNLYKHEPTRKAHLMIAARGGANVATVRAWRKQQNEFYELQQTGEPAGVATPEPTPAPPDTSPYRCYFCGTDEAIESMEQVFIHKPCKHLLKQALRDRMSD